MALRKDVYPILEYDTDERAVICPNRVGLLPLPKRAVMAFLPTEAETYAMEHDGKLVDRFVSATKTYPIYVCEHQGKMICLCQAPVGAPAAVQVMEYLIAGGVSLVVAAGSCGTLADLPENLFLIPTKALRDEGVSYHYLPPSREIKMSPEGTRAVKEALTRAGVDFMEVKTWTTDGFFRETEKMIHYRKEEGCQVVEMECAGLAACAQHRGITLGMLLFTADSLADTDDYKQRGWGKDSAFAALERSLDAAAILE